MKKGRTFCNLFIIQLPGSSRSKVFIFTRFYLIHIVCTFYIDILDNKINLETDAKELHWPKNIPMTKNPQFHSNLDEILALLSTHGRIILTKFDEDQTKIVDFLIVVYFWASVIFHESVSIFCKQLIFSFSKLL